MTDAQSTNPWNDIPLTDYESHMGLDSVGQLQAMNSLMKRQFALRPAETVMILGIAGGNGLEHIKRDDFRRVYGVDINRGYLAECRNRYPGLDGVLECICTDLRGEHPVLPHADLLIANLLIEYIGYACLQQAVLQVRPQHVSCIIQLNTEEGFVSDSPYLHVFDGLEQVHCQIEETELESAMEAVGYRATNRQELPLPNGKRLVRRDFTGRC